MKNNRYTKFLISLYSVFFVVFIAMSSLFAWQYANRIIKTEQNLMDRITLSVQSSLKEKYNGILFTSNSISYDRMLSSFAQNSDIISKMDSVESFGKYTHNLQNIGTAMLYYHSLGRAIVPEGFVSLETFIESLNAPSLSSLTFMEKLQHNSISPLALEDKILLFIPLPVSLSEHDRTLVLSMNHSYFKGEFEVYRLSKLETNVNLVDSKDALLIASKERINVDKPPSPLWEMGKSSQGRCFRKSYSLDFIDWKLIVTLSVRSVLKKYRDEILLYALFIVLLAVGCAFLIPLLADRHYRPLLRENEGMRKAHIKALPLLQTEFIIDLLHGHFSDWQEISRQAETLELPVFTGRFCFCAFFYDRVRNGASDDSLSLIGEALPPGLNGYGRIRSDNLIVFYISTGGEDEIMPLLSELLSNINGAERDYALAAGPILDDPHDMEASFMEAFNTISYMILNDKKGIMASSDLGKEDLTPLKEDDYLYKIKDEIIGALWSRNREEIVQKTDKYMEALEVFSNPIQLRGFMYMLLNHISRTFNQDYSYFSGKAKPISIISLGQFRQIVLSFCDTILETLETRNRYEVFIIRVEEHIRKHFADSDFTVETLADHFSLSRSYISRLYKAARKETLASFIRRTKLEEAHSLLQKGGISVEKTAFQVGYTDVSHFIKIFKKHYGNTPRSALGR